MPQTGRFGQIGGELIMLKKMFKDTFEHLGKKAVYQSQSVGFVDVLVLIKQPERVYELGDNGQFVERIAIFEILSEFISNPKIGDFLFIDGRKYKVYNEPLLNGSGDIFELTAIFVGKEQVKNV